MVIQPFFDHGRRVLGTVILALSSRLSHFIFCHWGIQAAFAKKNGMSQTMQEPCIAWNILKFFRCWLHGFHHNSRKVNLQLQNLRKKDSLPLTLLYHYILGMGYFTFLHLLGGYQPHQSPNSCSVGSTWAVTSYKVVPLVWSLFKHLVTIHSLELFLLNFDYTYHTRTHHIYTPYIHHISPKVIRLHQLSFAWAAIWPRIGTSAYSDASGPSGSASEEVLRLAAWGVPLSTKTATNGGSPVPPFSWISFCQFGVP